MYEKCPEARERDADEHIHRSSGSMCMLHIGARCTAGGKSTEGLGVKGAGAVGSVRRREGGGGRWGRGGGWSGGVEGGNSYGLYNTILKHQPRYRAFDRMYITNIVRTR